MEGPDATPPTPQAAATRSAPRWIEAAAWTLVATGVAARVVRFAANRSLWRDEAALALNLLDRSFGELAAPLDHDQMAPLGFLAAVRACVVLFGEGEPALRAVPLLAGLAALAVFGAVVREALPRGAALLALVLFAISEPLVFYSSELKPYSSDVLVALLVIWPALRVASRGPSPGRLAALAASGTLGVWLSLPAAIVCAGAGAALAAVRWRAGGPAAVLPLVPVGVLWAASFGAEWGWLLREVGDEDYLREFWAPAFAPLPFSSAGLTWYRDTFFAFFNDPGGLPATGLAAFAFAVGAVALVRSAPGAAAILLAPIVVALLLALAEVVPFPTSARWHLRDRHHPYAGRLILYTLPLVLPCVAAGVAFFFAPERRSARIAGWVAGGLLLAAPVQQLVVNLADPPSIQEARPLLERLAERRLPDDDLLVQNRSGTVVRYYARRLGLRDASAELVFEEAKDLPGLLAELSFLEPGQRVWLVSLHHPHWHSEGERARIVEWLERIAQPIESLQEHRAEATLYGVRTALRDWTSSQAAGASGSAAARPRPEGP